MDINIENGSKNDGEGKRNECEGKKNEWDAEKNEWEELILWTCSKSLMWYKIKVSTYPASLISGWYAIRHISKKHDCR